jgi:hypothetical protein
MFMYKKYIVYGVSQQSFSQSNLNIISSPACRELSLNAIQQGKISYFTCVRIASRRRGGIDRKKDAYSINVFGDWREKTQAQGKKENMRGWEREMGKSAEKE